MNGLFPRIGIFAKPNGLGIADILTKTCAFLEKRGHQIILDDVSSKHIKSEFAIANADKLGGLCDLVLVIGGDGSLLKVARTVVDYSVPVIGINGGNLGFLADVKPQNLDSSLGPILDGEYFEEERTMLNATIIQEGVVNNNHLALNDVVLHHGDIARLIEFQIYIDDQFVVSQRADGVITSTPTGSTAYALSGGGPIVYPTLAVLTLLPMFAHALNTRPIVIDKTSKIRLVLDNSNNVYAKFSCDGQTHISLKAGDEVHIQAYKNNLRLLHPKHYNYYALLREKLGWNVNPRD